MGLKFYLGRRPHESGAFKVYETNNETGEDVREVTDLFDVARLSIDIDAQRVHLETIVNLKLYAQVDVDPELTRIEVVEREGA